MILFLDTTKREQVGIALIGPNETFKKEFSVSRNLSENLPQFIALALKEASVDLKTISQLAVVTGPGSFANIRTGVAYINALSFSLDLPVAALSKEEADSLNKIPELIFEKKVITPKYGAPPNIT